MKALVERSIARHLVALASGEYTAEELLLAYLARIEEVEPRVGAFLTLDREGALRAARASDARRKSGGPIGALEGIPFGVKDNFCTKGMRTTCASKMLENFVPTYDATAVARLKQAGAVLVGKLNMDEFAMGSSCEGSALGVTRNPVSPDRVAGGSSGGSAAAVAAGALPFALGSDTGGSIRQPAAFCGVLGLKPTWGAISRYGLIAMASSLDCVGVIAKTAADTALVLDVLHGRDLRDATSCDCPADAPRAVTSLRGLRVGVVRELMESDAIAPEIVAATERAIAFLQSEGAVITPVALPSAQAALAAYCVICAAESSSNLARYNGIAYGLRAEHARDVAELYCTDRGMGFGDEVKRRILFGGYMLSKENRATYYERACCAREEIRRAMLSLVGREGTCDVLISPSTPSVAFPIGQSRSPVEQRKEDLCLVHAALAGLPAVSVPFGQSQQGLPIGIQLTAAPFGEALLLSLAERLEEVDT